MEAAHSDCEPKSMTTLHLCRRLLSTRFGTLSISSSTSQILNPNLHYSSSCTSTSTPTTTTRDQPTKESGKKWVTLPPFTPQIDAPSVGREIVRQNSIDRAAPTTALKWVRCCCPHLPMSLVQKLFRLRQIRKELGNSELHCAEAQAEENKPKRVSANYELVSGDVILLPNTVLNLNSGNSETKDNSCNEDEINFIRKLVLHKDSAIIVVNKPPGMPVQGGVGIKYCIDTLAAMSLKYEYSEPPRLVHRLDRDSSGILVLGRTQNSASVLHSIFREKTSGLVIDGVKNVPRALQKKYWALVFGSPKRLRGLISAPLTKILLEDGKSERITVAREESTSSQHAMTEYKVIKSAHGYSWLELHPITGRKHQIRVHCAEALGTPIVGDYKYGWKAHKNWEPVPCSEAKTEHERLPFGLESGGGSISDKHPRLHLHCRQIILPDIASALQQLEASSSSELDVSKLEMLDLVAPVPSYMKESWEILS